MSMTYPQQPHQHHAYPPPPAPPTPPRRPKWFTTTMLILGFIGAFVIGVAAGAGANSGSTSARETVTVRVPAPEGDAPPPAETAQAEAPPPAPAGPATTMSSGVYQVGVDVQGGQYKTAGPDASDSLGCYWARLKDDSGTFDAIIANGNLEGPGSFTINDGEFIELSGDCTWTKAG